MNTLKGFVVSLQEQLGSNSDRKSWVNLFEYLLQKVGWEDHFEVNDACVKFNIVFQNSIESNIEWEHLNWFQENEFEPPIYHAFNNQSLEIDLAPKIEGYFVKDKGGSLYLLFCAQLKHLESFSGLKLLKFTHSSFSFPLPK